VCRRPADKQHGGLWEFPGGKLKAGETRTDAVRRELAEELALETTELGSVLLTASDEASPFVIEFVETVALGAPELREHTDLGWFTVGELAELSLAPADAQFAALLLVEGR
jgi:mutator protein MutT